MSNHFDAPIRNLRNSYFALVTYDFNRARYLPPTAKDLSGAPDDLSGAPENFRRGVDGWTWRTHKKTRRFDNRRVFLLRKAFVGSVPNPRLSLFRIEESHVDGEAVLHVGLEQSFVAFFDFLDGDDLPSALPLRLPRRSSSSRRCAGERTGDATCRSSAPAFPDSAPPAPGSGRRLGR